MLINNIAWFARHLPVLAVGDGGDYWLRGIHVDDLAALSADLGDQDSNVCVDAVGPERATFRTLVMQVRDAVGRKALIVSVPGRALTSMTTAMGLVMRDRILTPDEYHAMADGLADSAAPASGQVRLSDWLTKHADSLGRRYANDTRRPPSRSGQ